MSRTSSFYLITDSHYVSKENWVEGKPFTSRERSDQIALKLSPEILDAFIEKVIADSAVDTVIFTGDNVNNGDMQSHYEFRERLEKLTAAGKKVYVTTATHDYCGNGDDENFFTSCRYTETGTEPIPSMRKKDLFDFYYDYGPKQAISVHEESGSYSVSLGDGVTLIMINDNGNGRSHCGLFEDGVKWLTGEIDSAKSRGELVLLAVHHPVISPFDAFAHMVEFEMYGGYKELWQLMCEKDVRVIFTGHTHIQNIRKYTDDNGRYFYDVSTMALVNAAGKMRKVSVDADSGKCDITSVGMGEIDIADKGDESTYSYLYHLNFPGIVEKLIPLANENYDDFLALADGLLPADKLAKHRGAVRLVCRKAEKLKLSTIMKFGKTSKQFSGEKRKELKNKSAINAVYEILRCIYTGNAPYTPDTDEYVIMTGAAARVDRIVDKFKIDKLKSIIPPGSSLEEMSRDFLYNNRTGDDDALTLNLK